MTAPLRIVFAGTPQFSVPALDALHAAGHSIVAVYTQPDRPAGRGRGLTASALKHRALELGLPVEQPVSLKERATQSRLASHAPDLIVVVAYGLLLPQAVLDIPSLGCLNIHASLLPRWRGAAPIQRAVLAGDDVSGVTIMKMDSGLDTGPTLLQREVTLDARETGGSLHDRLGPLGARAVVEAVAGWAAGTLEAHPQPTHGVTYAAKLSKAEARIDWRRSALEIDRQVRAFDPWPVAETKLGEEQVRIWEARPVLTEALATHRPGDTVALPGRLLVATGDGMLELLKLQLPGRKVLSASELSNALDLTGVRFGGAS